MKKYLTIMLLLLSIDSFAQGMTCLSKLLPYNRFSGVHQIYREEWVDNRDVLDSEMVKNSIKFLTLTKLFCQENEIQIKVEPVCATTVADLPQSTSCFAFTNLGYFIVSRDQAKNMNFIFSKDKTYAE